MNRTQLKMNARQRIKLSSFSYGFVMLSAGRGQVWPTHVDLICRRPIARSLVCVRRRQRLTASVLAQAAQERAAF